MKPLLSKHRKSLLISGLLALLLISGATVAFIATKEGVESQQQTGATQTGKRSNRLIKEKSPYLLQHAYNPVDWYPWGEEAFAKARQENKPLFLSIGYSTCYWCHVMEREIFENAELAALMNRYVVSIKVDREERPDVDRVYMSALQAMTGSGGWPMSLYLTPDLKPFFGATYIPPDRFGKLLEKVHEVWTTNQEKLRQSSQELTDLLKQQIIVRSATVELEKTVLTKGFEQFRQSYDKQYAGFGHGPKFPQPVVFNFLLRYYQRFGEPEAREMSLVTLRQMAAGGVYDHLGGGFHRYSVDGQWRVPHFEKMLYDQAQLVSAYLEAYQITHDEFRASIARATLGFVLREMTDKDGGFYSAEDAESAPNPKQPEAKEEGAYYVWTKAEIERSLGPERTKVFIYVYGIEAGGNALEDPQRVFVGKNILYEAHTIDDTAHHFAKSAAEISRVLTESRAKLLAAREQRQRPHLDDKVIVSWNGLMISAMARAYQVLGDPAYLRAAERAADFISAKLYDPKTKRLMRRYRAGEARYDANLEDYAYFTMGLLDLYEAALDERWLQQALELTDQQNNLFYDDKNGGFFDATGRDGTLLFRTKSDYDAAEPAGNSIATLNLLRLAQETNNQRWRTMADRTLALFGERLTRVPQAMAQMLVALDFQLDKPKQIIIAGNRQSADTQQMLREIHKRFIPNKIILLADGGAGQQWLSQHLPVVSSMKMLSGKATAYICENYACKLPTSDLTVMARLLAGQSK